MLTYFCPESCWYSIVYLEYIRTSILTKSHLLVMLLAILYDKLNLLDIQSYLKALIFRGLRAISVRVFAGITRKTHIRTNKKLSQKMNQVKAQKYME